MKKPNVSVIMAAYNAERFIPKAIESIIKQTFKDWELIIINDGSTDNTLKIIEKYKEKDNRIKLINLKKNSGPSTARNNGLKKAKGKYIAILDADDVAHSKRLEKQVSFLDKNKKVFLVGGFARYIDEEGNILGKDKTKKVEFSSLEDATKNPVHSTITFRNNEKTYYRRKFPVAQDFDLFLRILKKNKKIVILPEIFVNYRKHLLSVSYALREESKKSREEIEKIYFGKKTLSKIPMDNRNKPEVLNELQIKRLSVFYESNETKKYRKLFREFIKQDGILKWKGSLFYYFASFFSKKTRIRIKKFLELK